MGLGSLGFFFGTSIAPLVNYSSGHFGLETAHHVLKQVVQNMSTLLNSLAPDQNAVPFLMVGTAAEVSTLCRDRETESTTVCWQNKLCWESTESNETLGRLSVFTEPQWGQTGRAWVHSGCHTGSRADKGGDAWEQALKQNAKTRYGKPSAGVMLSS